MKNYKLALFAAFALLLMVGISSCNKDNSTNASSDLYDAPEWMVPQPDNSAADISEATLDSPCDLVPVGSDYRFNDVQMMGNKQFRGKRVFLPLAKILRTMKIDSAQRILVKGYIMDFRLCTKDALLALRESEKTILAPFNEQRKAIYAAWKAGTITREEATQQLKTLNQQVKDALKNNQARLVACEAMKACRKTLFDNIAAILTPDQLLQWNDWLSKVPEIDCSKFL